MDRCRSKLAGDDAELTQLVVAVTAQAVDVGSKSKLIEKAYSQLILI